MKIEKVKMHHLRMQLATPFETSFGCSATRDCILVEIAADGVIGYGECVADQDPGYSYETIGTAWHISKDFLIPLLLGKELSHPSNFKPLAAGIRGHPMAKAALEMALWDIIGKQKSQPLAQLLSGVQKTVPVGVSIGIQSSPTDLVKKVSQYINQGYQRVKIKIKPGRDIEETQTVRNAFPELILQVDANSAYTLENAYLLKPLDELDLLLIEQPLAEDDIWDHHILQAKLNTPICLDESIQSVRHARQAIDLKATRIINIKAGRVGGLSEAIAIHDLCQEKQIPVWCGGMLETGVGRASNLALASLPNFTLPSDISASDRYYERDITNEVFELNPDSTINVPDQPGLGVSINRIELEKVTLATDVFP
jgi:O-succinylbenzoate synthase